jgi:hypothetical protein
LLGKGVFLFSHGVEIGTFRVVTADIFDKGGTVFGSTIRGTNITAFTKEAIESENAGKRIFL